MNNLNINIITLYDDISGYGISVINDELYLIKDDKLMKLSALNIIEREEN